MSETVNGARYNWQIRHPYGGAGSEQVAIMVTPHSGLLPRWRFVVPHDCGNIVKWGIGSTDADAEVNTEPRGKVHSQGAIQIQNGPTVIWFGATEPLSKAKAAYLVFKGAAPHYVMFGQAETADAPPDNLEGVSFGPHDHHAVNVPPQA